LLAGLPVGKLTPCCAKQFLYAVKLALDGEPEVFPAIVVFELALDVVAEIALELLPHAAKKTAAPKKPVSKRNNLLLEIDIFRSWYRNLRKP